MSDRMQQDPSRTNSSKQNRSDKKRYTPLNVCQAVASVLLAAVIIFIGVVVLLPAPSYSDVGLISAGGHHTVGVRKDGTVAATTPKKRGDYGQCDVKDWSGIVAVSAGGSHTVGLKKDGTVVATGSDMDGQCGVGDWSGITMISAGTAHTVGLKKDGTVVAVGNNEYGQCGVSDWTDIVAVSAGERYTVGLREDGTVVATAHDYAGYSGECDVEKWENVQAVSAGGSHTVALFADGTVAAVGYDRYGQCTVADLRDVVAVSAGSSHTVCLKKDGTVTARGYSGFGQCDGVEKWTHIVAIAAGFKNTVGLRSDRTVVSTRFAATPLEDDRQCEVQDWENMKLPNGVSASASLPVIEEAVETAEWETMRFGTYEQDGDAADGKEAIEWIVLDKQDGKALVLSKYALDCQPYNTVHKDVTWKTSTLRTWLNETFLKAAFSEEEQSRIVASRVAADSNREWGTSAGSDTNDKVFLLSMSQAEQYFDSDTSRICEPTPYAIAKGVKLSVRADDAIETEADEKADCWWLLRTPGRYATTAVYIDRSGVICDEGVSAENKDNAVRPAMWIRLTSK